MIILYFSMVAFFGKRTNAYAVSYAPLNKGKLYFFFNSELKTNNNKKILVPQNKSFTPKRYHLPFYSDPTQISLADATKYENFKNGFEKVYTYNISSTEFNNVGNYEVESRIFFSFENDKDETKPGETYSVLAILTSDQSNVKLDERPDWEVIAPLFKTPEEPMINGEYVNDFHLLSLDAKGKRDPVKITFKKERVCKCKCYNENRVVFQSYPKLYQVPFEIEIENDGTDTHEGYITVEIQRLSNSFASFPTTGQIKKFNEIQGDTFEISQLSPDLNGQARYRIIPPPIMAGESFSFDLPLLVDIFGHFEIIESFRPIMVCSQFEDADDKDCSVNEEFYLTTKKSEGGGFNLMNDSLIVSDCDSINLEQCKKDSKEIPIYWSRIFDFIRAHPPFSLAIVVILVLMIVVGYLIWKLKKKNT